MRRDVGVVHLDGQEIPRQRGMGTNEGIRYWYRES